MKEYFHSHGVKSPASAASNSAPNVSSSEFSGSERLLAQRMKIDGMKNGTGRSQDDQPKEGNGKRKFENFSEEGSASSAKVAGDTEQGALKKRATDREQDDLIELLYGDLPAGGNQMNTAEDTSENHADASGASSDSSPPLHIHIGSAAERQANREALATANFDAYIAWRRNQ